MIDKYIGRNTFFDCYALNPTNIDNSYVRGLSLEDQKGKKFLKLDDSSALYNSLSVYGVPFELVRFIAIQQKFSPSLFYCNLKSGPKYWDELDVHT